MHHKFAHSRLNNPHPSTLIPQPFRLMQEADSDGNGLLTVEEVLRVFQNEQVLAAEKRVMRAYMKR